MPSTFPGSVLIVGASRGLGLGLAREYLHRGAQVTATVRGDARTGLHDLAEGAPGQVEIERLDIDDAAQIAALRERLSARHFDLLFVNAGIANDPGETAAAVSTEDFARVMRTNALAPMRVIEAFQGQVSETGVIAVMSSGLGSVAGNETGGWEVYRASKAALNTLLRSHAVRGKGARIFLAIAPGWVRTDMGGPDAPLDVQTSMRGVADTIAAQQGKPGVRFLDHTGKTVAW